MENNRFKRTIACLLVVAGISACTGVPETISSGNLSIRVTDKLTTEISDKGITKPLINNALTTEYIVVGADTFSEFEGGKPVAESVTLNGLKGSAFIYQGVHKQNNVQLTKILSITTFDTFPGWAFFDIKYVNNSTGDVKITGWANHNFTLLSAGDKPDFWSLQASSTGARKTWIVPVDSSFEQRNYQGMNDPDYGGGIPVLDLWRRDAGIAIGHTATLPTEISLPVSKKEGSDKVKINISKTFTEPLTLKPGDTLVLPQTFVTTHKGDFFTTLQQYSAYMQHKGIVMPPSEPLAFEPMWCAWGYMRRFTVDEIIGTLPKVKELGFTWVTVDDGYQQAEGDWMPVPDKFPQGEQSMKQLVDAIHNAGFKAQLWWAPLAADPGSKLLKEQPDLILQNADGSPQKISWWDSYYLSPVYEPVLAHTRELVNIFISRWGFDGLKLDGQHLNACPADYNPAHKLAYPAQASEGMPAFFKAIYETARTAKPSALVQICPCGDAFSFYNMPYTNQFVASDPVGSIQVRTKGKTFKALAPNTAYFGDHIELSDNHSDFASTVGVGGVPGTKFTWPADNPYSEEKSLLTPENEANIKKWMSIYQKHRLSQGEYLGGLYDIGYDIPETHVIRKADTLFYAFYAPEWNGALQIKGLPEKTYQITDYENQREMGMLKPGETQLNVAFKGHLMLMAYPGKQ